MTHVVFFRFAQANHAQQAATKLRALAGVVPSLRDIEVGIDELKSERSWDLCLITRFDDRAGMDAYQVHPAHNVVANYLHEHATGAAAVDWS